jgi:N-acetylmuramoyl-L-alanine amidase
VRVFKPTGILFLAAILLAGCTTAPTTLEEAYPSAATTNENPSLNWSAPGLAQKPVVPAAKINSPVVIRTNVPPPVPPPVIPKPKPAPVVTWVALDDWAAAHKTGAPHFLSKSPATTYAIGSSNSVMVVGVGSIGATWNGIEINLGFAPEFIDGEIFLHGLDLKKNLEPLLCAPPISFPQTNRVIVIDPGHGGDNHGTVSVLDGRFEKEFTLDWAKRLKPLLETNGWKVFLTRTSDLYVTNADRVTFAETHHADLFISLHFNSTEQDKKTGKRDEKTGGLETYCITPVGMPSTLTRGFADPWYENLPNNNFDAQNLQLAVRVHGAVLRAVGMEDHGVRRSRFDTVLRGQNRPAILVEGGYLSNPAEAKLIESPEYRQKLAEGVAAALK